VKGSGRDLILGTTVGSSWQLRKTKKQFRKHSRWPGWDFNAGNMWKRSNGK